ncbi:FKBP-type peptidyl-prolyl cis-trans isomerase N-terminal domain-containing protein [Methylotetracoccus oryzae]|uniref:FKBP-type peptidyl-prolyl cis-trans isomerase N-terminal domain-containing protein n=1 Tax=Methylotetracoccus oryzae TaxID=1919059 RepID=UPI001118B24F|nr:FKBP-type peptidyl-prolyl cis-trans isomerase N-terminal domain-containing protein [Methylotetracoccus oryzae]
MNKIVLPLLMVLSGTALAAETGQSPAPRTADDELLNYSVGYQIGEDFKRQSMPGKPEALSQGLMDALSGKQPTVNRVEMTRVLADFKKKMVESQVLTEKQEAKARIQAADEVFAKNKADPSVVKLPSGVQYRVLQDGKGTPPKAGEVVTMKYQASILGGYVFDQTGDKTKEYEVDKLIKGWSEAMLLMQPGAKWEVFIPASLGYKGHTPLRDRPIKLEVELVSAGPAKPGSAEPSTEEQAPHSGHHPG